MTLNEIVDALDIQECIRQLNNGRSPLPCMVQIPFVPTTRITDDDAVINTDAACLYLRWSDPAAFRLASIQEGMPRMGLTGPRFLGKILCACRSADGNTAQGLLLVGIDVPGIMLFPWVVSEEYSYTRDETVFLVSAGTGREVYTG